MTDSQARIVTEQGLEARFASIVEPAIEQIGYRLVRVKISGLNGRTVQIMAERPDGTMAIEDCEAVSKAISPILDVEDPTDKPYHLEVSSPGIDRPLVRRSDFEVWAGFVMKLDTNRIVHDRKRFRGRVVAVGTDSVTLERDQPAYGEAMSVEIPLDAVAEARLVLTDDLIQASLKADKAARKARGAALLEGETEDDDTPDETPDGPTTH